MGMDTEPLVDLGPYLTTSQVGEILHVTVSAVRVLALSGKLRFTLDPVGRRLFPRADVLELAAERARAGRAQRRTLAGPVPRAPAAAGR